MEKVGEIRWMAAAKGLAGLKANPFHLRHLG